jgi:D-alanyl-D-alanine carboxypeptidase
MVRTFYKFILFALLCIGQATLAQSVSVTATSWIVADENGRIIQGENITQQRSIASITKLMTAMVILDAHQDLDEKINGISRLNLLQLMLVKSDNQAAETLCQNYPNGRSACITAMNVKARSISLTETLYVDPSGLNIMNVSTASELVNIVLESSKYPEIVAASNTAQLKIKKKKNSFTVNNTNPLVASKDFIVSKTGYIRASGGCIVMMLDTKIGRRIVVLLNSKNTHTRIPEASRLALAF